jgi:signal transduction histidine kinase
VNDPTASEARPDPISGARSIRVELIASLAVVLVMGIVALVFSAELLGQRRHVDVERERWTEHAASVSELIESLREPDGAISTERARWLIQQDLGTSAQMRSIELFEIEDGSTALLVSAGLPDDALGAPSLSSQESTDGDRIVITRRVGSETGPSGYMVRMVVFASPWSRGTSWAEILTISGGVALLLLVLGTLLVEVQVVRPLRQLRAASDRVALGDLEARVPESGSLELVTVAAGFNRMIAGLNEQRAELEHRTVALRRSEHMAAVGRLSSGVAHEVGNPLAALVGYTDLLLGDPEIGDESRALLERVRSMTQRIQDIVSQLLDYSRQRPQRLDLVTLDAIVDEVLALARAHPIAAQAELGADLLGTRDGSDALVAWGDEGMISQVLLNLVLNGARAAIGGSADAPQLRVIARRHGNEVHVDVVDNGPGVAAEQRDTIFEPFFTTQPSGTGTGLGLAISRGLAEGMDGRLELLQPGDFDRLDSKHPGACFRLTLLPDAPPSRSRAPAVAAEPA